ncbi:MAG: AAA family ATPase [Acidobacteriota bacterium]
MSLAGERIGPYEVLSSIGSGGMGIVCRARHVETGALCALKTVRVKQGPMLAGMRREIAALSRLSHPYIVRVQAWGIDRGRPWLAMDLVEGEVWRAHVASITGATHAARDVTDSLRAPTVTIRRPSRDEGESTSSFPGPADPHHLSGVLTLARRVCHALAYLHGEGIVHRDLKPDNILVRGGAPILVDFGVMAPFGGISHRESLQFASEGLGTAWYMAPETIRGELGDARVDLYALGCILYEMIAGHPPFLGATTNEVLARHLNEVPVPPSYLVPGLDPGIEGLVLLLLSKDPALRIGHADEVASHLARLGAGPDPEPLPRCRPVLYRPSLAGRGEILRALGGRLSRLSRGGGAVAIAGESGSGKTRLLMEVAAMARDKGFRVLLGGCESEGEAARALSALCRPLQAMGDACRDEGGVTAVFGPRAALLARYEPTLADLCPGADPPPELPHDAAIERLHDYLTRSLRSFARPPCLLVLDDLQWCDDLTLGFLEALHESGQLPEMPLLVLGAYRSDECPDRVRAFARRGLHLTLEPLGEEEVRHIAAGMLAMDPPPEALIGSVLGAAEGNPLFVAEHLRSAVEQGLLGRSESGLWELLGSLDAALPSSVQELVGKRLSALSRVATRIAEVAAVLGSTFDDTLVADVSQLAAEDVSDAVSQLVDRSILVELPMGRLRFAHATLRDSLYEPIDASRRRELHGRAAAAVESRGGERSLAEVAEHWRRAGDTDRAREAYRRAGELATGLYNYREAARLFEAAMQQCAGATAERAWLGIARAEVCRRLARMDESLALTEAAREDGHVAGDASAEIEADHAIESLYSMMGQVDLAAQANAKGLARARETGRRRDEARLLGSLGMILRYQGDHAGCEQALAAALEMQRADGLVVDEASTLTNISAVRHMQGRYDEALRLTRASLAINRETRQRHSELTSSASLVVLHNGIGQWDEAERVSREALDLARELRRPADGSEPPHAPRGRALGARAGRRGDGAAPPGAPDPPGDEEPQVPGRGADEPREPPARRGAARGGDPPFSRGGRALGGDARRGLAGVRARGARPEPPARRRRRQCGADVRGGPRASPRRQDGTEHRDRSPPPGRHREARARRRCLRTRAPHGGAGGASRGDRAEGGVPRRVRPRPRHPRVGGVRRGRSRARTRDRAAGPRRTWKRRPPRHREPRARPGGVARGRAARRRDAPGRAPGSVAADRDGRVAS